MFGLFLERCELAKSIFDGIPPILPHVYGDHGAIVCGSNGKQRRTHLPREL
jgi:hypothetical protein